MSVEEKAAQLLNCWRFADGLNHMRPDQEMLSCFDVELDKQYKREKEPTRFATHLRRSNVNRHSFTEHEFVRAERTNDVAASLAMI